MILISTSARASQVGMAIHTKPSGRPEENDNRLTDAVRQLRIANHTVCHAAGFLFFDLVLVCARELTEAFSDS